MRHMILGFLWLLLALGELGLAFASDGHDFPMLVFFRLFLSGCCSGMAAYRFWQATKR